MSALLIGMGFAALGGIGGAGLITYGGGSGGGDGTVARKIGQPCWICLWGFGFLSAIEWWLLDFVNEHPAPIPVPEFSTPGFLGLITGLAGATITNAVMKR